MHVAKTYLFCILTCPVGAYYPEGLNPVKIAVEAREVRAVRGGTGFTKCGGNYAASLHASHEAGKKGFSQVLWLDGVEQKYIEEVGAMNVMFKINGKIITPSLDKGTVLPGVTRRTALQILRHWGYEVEERDLSIDELIEAADNGTLEEAWGTGTAAVISPIGEISFEDKVHVIGDFKIGELTQKLYDTITAIQWGKAEDPFGWIVPVC